MDAGIITPSPSKNSSNLFADLPASALPIGSTIKEYVIIGVIGEGGFGIVYSALDTLLERNVAIKEYMPATIANRLDSTKVNLRSLRHQQTFEAGMQGFIDEARLLAQFKHSALVEILRFWEANGTAYMVMPHYSGKTLRNLLKENRNQCTEAWLKKILIPILDAVDLLHSNNIYHRDIAPDNIVIQDNSQPVLLDLGSARRVIAGMQSALTVVVKPGYAPIEQYTEDTANEQGPWTDIYALGAVLYFAITGAAPSASVSRMMRDGLKPLNTEDFPQFSAPFLAAINQALQLRPIDRFASIESFRAALDLHNLAQTDALSLSSDTDSSYLEKNNCAPHIDDEITKILTEEEIDQFKGKLLDTLAGNQTSLSAQPVNSPEIDPFNENILANSAITSQQSINSFDDMKDLLNNKPKPTTTKKISKTQETVLIKSKLDKKSKLTNSSFIANLKANRLPIAIVAALVTTIILVSTYWLSGSSKTSKELAENSLASADAATVTSTEYLNNQSLNKTDTTTVLAQDATLKTDFDPLSDSLDSDNPLNDPLYIPSHGKYTDHATLTTDHVEADIIEPVENTAANVNINSFTTNTASEKIQPTARVEKSKVSSDPVKAMGTAKVTLVPWGEIWVDGKRYGVSPPVRELTLAPGTYSIELRNPSLPAEVRSLTFNKGENEIIYHNFTEPQQQPKKLNSSSDQTNKSQQNDQSHQQQKTIVTEKNSQPEQPTATAQTKITEDRQLNIKILPWGEVYLNGKMVGVTPPLHQIKLSPGEHIVEIRHPNYTTQTIHISDSDSVTAPIEHVFK